MQKYRHLLITALIMIVSQSLVGSHFRSSVHPIKDRYIIVLNDTVDADSVEGIARGLASEHAGRVLGTMKTAIKAFGFKGPESAARAMLHKR